MTGFALSLSSTPLVLQLLAERTAAQHAARPLGFAILLFQDIAVMPMLAILPLLGSTAAAEHLTSDAAERRARDWRARGAGLRRPLRAAPGAAHRRRDKVSEAFTAAALLVVIGTALLVDAVGLSMALGAFVAGLLLADSEYRHELEADIEPFKGLLLGLFFMSVGMTANLGLLLEQPGLHRAARRRPGRR